MYIFQPDRFLLKQQVRKFSPYITGRTLDLGAGTFDRYSGSFSGVGEYVRMDIAPRGGIDVVGTAYDIPFPDEHFDSIVCTQVFEHLARPFDAAREMYRVLRRGGHALVTVPQLNELHEEPHDYFRYTRFGMRSVFESAGFETLAIDQRGGYYAALAQLRIRHLIDTHSLYRRPLIGRMFGKWIALYARLMLFVDRRALRPADRKHAIGWLFVFTKPL